jgi:hypothetical protein
VSGLVCAKAATLTRRNAAAAMDSVDFEGDVAMRMGLLRLN